MLPHNTLENSHLEANAIGSMISNDTRYVESFPIARPFGLSIVENFLCLYAGCTFRTTERATLERHVSVGIHYGIHHRVGQTNGFATRDAESSFQSAQPHASNLRQTINHTAHDISHSSPLQSRTTVSADAERVAETYIQESNMTTEIEGILPDRHGPPAFPSQLALDHSTKSANTTSARQSSEAKKRRRFKRNENGLFSCEHCPKTFTRATTLREHIRVHSNERPFKCALCPLTFTRLKDHNRHSLLHKGERKFICKGRNFGISWGCGHRFAREDSLSAHFRSGSGRHCLMLLWRAIHRSGSPRCGADYATDASLSTHFKSIEGKGCFQRHVVNLALATCQSLRNDDIEEDGGRKKPPTTHTRGSTSEEQENSEHEVTAAENSLVQGMVHSKYLSASPAEVDIPSSPDIVEDLAVSIGNGSDATRQENIIAQQTHGSPEHLSKVAKVHLLSTTFSTLDHHDAAEQIQNDYIIEQVNLGAPAHNNFHVSVSSLIFDKRDRFWLNFGSHHRTEVMPIARRSRRENGERRRIATLCTMLPLVPWTANTGLVVMPIKLEIFRHRGSPQKVVLNLGHVTYGKPSLENTSETYIKSVSLSSEILSDTPPLASPWSFPSVPIATEAAPRGSGTRKHTESASAVQEGGSEDIIEKRNTALTAVTEATVSGKADWRNPQSWKIIACHVKKNSRGGQNHYVQVLGPFIPMTMPGVNMIFGENYTRGMCQDSPSSRGSVFIVSCQIPPSYFICVPVKLEIMKWSQEHRRIEKVLLEVGNYSYATEKMVE